MRLLSGKMNRASIHTGGERKFVQTLAERGPGYFLSNSHASSFALDFDGMLIPLVVSDSNPADASVCSIESHYVESPLKQMGQLKGLLTPFLGRPFLMLLRAVIRAGGLGRVVYLNDWLMTTNFEVRLNTAQVQEITRFLTSKFPERAIVVRSVNRWTRRKLFLALRGSGYTLLRGRRIYVFDPLQENFKLKENLVKDLRLLEQWPGPIKQGPLSQEGIQRVAELYRGLYLQKYACGNPAFTLPFFEAVINGSVFEARYLEIDGEILAFTAWKQESESMLATLIGYDLSKPQKMGLYRTAFAIDFKTSLERKVPYNLSSGAGSFKKLRGAVPTTEYDAVYFRHLSQRQRLFWRVFQMMMFLAEKSEGERIDLKKAPQIGSQ
jgi:hypothetical protein